MKPKIFVTPVPTISPIYLDGRVVRSSCIKAGTIIYQLQTKKMMCYVAEFTQEEIQWAVFVAKTDSAAGASWVQKWFLSTLLKHSERLCYLHNHKVLQIRKNSVQH